MTEPRPARPPLATIICIYLIVTAFIPLQVIWIVVWGWFHSIFAYSRILLSHSPSRLVICALTLAGAIALWQMRKAAFFLLATRLILSIALQVANLPRSVAHFHRMSAALPRAIAGSALRFALACDVTEWLLSTLIVWYVYRITSRQCLSLESADPELST